MQSPDQTQAGPARPAVFAADEFTQFDAVEQARRVRSGEVSALELLDAALRRIEAVNPQLNALASLGAGRAREALRLRKSDGVLAGVPTLVKDLLPYPGLPTSFGSRAMGAQIAVAGSDYTAALDAAGLVVLGKSATSELGMLGTTETLALGPTRNPWDLTRSTGGSSGGAVAAVASGMVPVAHASDGGGSIRGPAAFNGLFGFKPSRGATRSVGMGGETPLAFMVSDHCVSRTVRDSAAWLDATAADASPLFLQRRPADTSPGPLRIGVYTETAFGREPDADVKQALAQAVRLCESAGHHVFDTEGPRFDAEASSAAFFLLAGATVGGLFQYLQGLMGPHFSAEAFEPFTQELARRAGAADQGALARAFEQVRASVASASAAFASADVLLCPTTPFTAPPLGRITPASPFDEIVGFTNAVAGYTAIASMAGWCAMSMPLYRSGTSGLPIGLHFAAPQGADARLFDLAYQLEAMCPWL